MTQHRENLNSLLSAVANPAGLRTDCQRLVERLVAVIGAMYSFIAIENTESGELEISAATGLDATSFRRLETRVSRSAILRVIDHAEPIDILVNDEPTLDFLVLNGIVSEIMSVPILLDEVCVGCVSVGIDKSKKQDRRFLRDCIGSAATIASVALRIDRLRRERDSKAEERIGTEAVVMHDRFAFDNLIGNSSQMRQMIGLVRQVARSNANVLIRGDVGTGKESIASTIHFNSLRSKRPFVAFLVASTPADLIDTSLFGTDESGGAFADAEGGSLYIDEIADLPTNAQLRLLDHLATRSFTRADSRETLRANVRILAGSQRSLEDMVAADTFSRRLFAKLSMFSIFLPPLNERKSDVLLLAEHFVEKYGREHGKRIKRISTPAIDMLTAYHFPGNVRELENAIERAVIACDAGVIHGRHLPPTLQTAEATLTETRLSLADAVDTFERDLIQDALKSSRGNIAKAARSLSTTERILGYKIKNLRIDTMRFRS